MNVLEFPSHLMILSKHLFILSSLTRIVEKSSDIKCWEEEVTSCYKGFIKNPTQSGQSKGDL